MYKFFDYPVFVDPNVYANQKQSFLGFLKDGLVDDSYAVYEIGEVELPGVSDLDFLILMDDVGQKNLIDSSLSSWSLVDRPLYVGFDALDHLAFVTHHFHFDHCGGTRLLDSPILDRSKVLKLLFSWKILFFSCLRNLYIPYFQQSIPIKKTLSWLYDMRYPILYLSDLVDLDPRVHDFLERFSVFRRRWYDHTDVDVLSDFLVEGIDVCRMLVDACAPLLVEHCGPMEPHFDGGRYPTVFMFADTASLRQKTESYFSCGLVRDRFLVLHPGFDYHSWKGDLDQSLQTVLSFNPKFLAFGFDHWGLSFLLLCKKIVDFFILSRFVRHEKT